MVAAMCVYCVSKKMDVSWLKWFSGEGGGTHILWQAIDLSMLVRRLSLGHLRRLPYRNWFLGLL